MHDVRSDGGPEGAMQPARTWSIAESSENGRRLISVSGELERETMLEFIGACTDHPDRSIVIDLGGLTFMDGGGYSSLMVIREIAQASQRTVTIRNARGQPARLIGLIADLEAAQAVSGTPADQQSGDSGLDAAADEEVERRYSDLLAEFAQTMTDVPIQEILDHLVQRIVEVLPIDGARVTFTSPGREPYVTASDESGLAHEPPRRELGEGRGSVFSFPMHHEDRVLGTLELSRNHPGALGARQLAAAQTFANVAAAYLVNAEARADLLASTQQANYIALHDPLTGLPNRALLFERLVSAMHRCRRTGALVAIMYIDLDSFKAINDTFGHHVGDEVLMIVAERLTALLRPGDTVARLGGDEFAILCDDVAETSHLGPIADRVIDAFRLPFDVSSGPVTMRASVGIGVGDRTSTSPERILEMADTAMYRAKRGGGGSHVVLDPRGS